MARRRKRNVSMKTAACTVGGSAHKSRSASARKCGAKWSTSVKKFASTGGRAAARSSRSPIGKKGRRRRRRNPEDLPVKAAARTVAKATPKTVEANPRRRRKHRRGRRRNPSTALLNPSRVQTALVTALGAVVGGAAMAWWENRKATGPGPYVAGYVPPIGPFPAQTYGPY
jgi:hypothetical protein